MQNASIAARSGSQESVFQEIGTVTRAGGELVVETASGRFPAVCAVSCMVVPETGDEVLVAVPPSGELYVLAVLGRGGEAPLRVRLDADATIECAGSLTLFAAERLDLSSAREVATTAPNVVTTAAQATLAAERLSVVARLVEAHTDQVKGVLGFVDTVLERLTQKVKRSYRFVEEIDMTRARQVEIRAEQTVHLRGKNAFVSAEELVKMNGEQIHLG